MWANSSWLVTRASRAVGEGQHIHWVQLFLHCWVLVPMQVSYHCSLHLMGWLGLNLRISSGLLRWNASVSILLLCLLLIPILILKGAMYRMSNATCIAKCLPAIWSWVSTILSLVRRFYKSYWVSEVEIKFSADLSMAIYHFWLGFDLHLTLRVGCDWIYVLEELFSISESSRLEESFGLW